MEDSDQAGGWDQFFHDQVYGSQLAWSKFGCAWVLGRFLCAPRYSVDNTQAPALTLRLLTEGPFCRSTPALSGSDRRNSIARKADNGPSRYSQNLTNLSRHRPIC
jgi:hypothetical protein